MEFYVETIKSVQARMNILRKGTVSYENSVNYYKTLLEKTPEDPNGKTSSKIWAARFI